MGLTVVAVPFAGGDRYAYRTLINAAPAEWNWQVLDLPGRGPRGKEPRLRNIGEMADSLFADFRTEVPAEPYVVLGHSMGAVLAFELLSRIRFSGLEMPCAAHFSSMAAPSVVREKAVSHLPSADFWEAMKAYDGVPAGILANEALKNYFEPILRDDFAAAEVYRREAGEVAPFDIPFYISAGADENIPESHLKSWQEFSTRPIVFQLYPGRHFFLLKQPDPVIRRLACSRDQDYRSSP